MKVAMTCHICGKPAFSNCILCGKPTCPEHMDERGLACRNCASGKKADRASRGPGDPGGVMG